MKTFTDISDPQIPKLLRQGRVGVLRTDTLYGIVASARNKRAVERVYMARGREETKPCIVLIADISQIWDQKVVHKYRRILEEYWPGPISLVLPAGEKTPAYVHRGGQSVAFRVPYRSDLRELLSRSGPLIAPSANPYSLPPAATIAEAKRYFGDDVDFYVDSGHVSHAVASRVIGINADGSQTVFR